MGTQGELAAAGPAPTVPLVSPYGSPVGRTWKSAIPGWAAQGEASSPDSPTCAPDQELVEGLSFDGGVSTPLPAGRHPGRAAAVGTSTWPKGPQERRHGRGHGAGICGQPR